MTKNYYVRVKKGEEWINALRDGQRYVDEATANDMLDTAEEKGIEACMFFAEKGKKPELVRRTQVGVEL